MMGGKSFIFDNAEPALPVYEAVQAYEKSLSAHQIVHAVQSGGLVYDKGGCFQRAKGENGSALC